MMIIDAPKVSLDVALQSYIKLSLQPARRNLVLFVPTFEMQKFAISRLNAHLDMLPTWLCEPMARRQRGLLEYTNGNCIRILNSSLKCRGIAIDYCALYDHPDYPWTKDDLNYILPALRGSLDQHFFYVTE